MSRYSNWLYSQTNANVEEERGEGGRRGELSSYASTKLGTDVYAVVGPCTNK